MKEIDARGLACPAPVLMAKAAIEDEKANILKIIVDNKASKENVSIFLESKKFDVSVQEKNGDFFITGKGSTIESPADKNENKTETGTGTKKILIMIPTDRMGYGDDELGKKLILSFIKTIKEIGPDLWRLVFVNNGVKLCINGSPALDDLKELNEKGVSILVCGTCLTHFNLLDQKALGETTNMLDIVTSMQVADQVVNI